MRIAYEEDGDKREGTTPLALPTIAGFVLAPKG